MSAEVPHSLASAASATNPSAKAAISTTAPEPRLLTVGLGFTAGFVDTLAFVALYSFFSAHVTGNFVVLGSALSQPVHGLIAKLLALPTFIAAVAATRLYGRSLERREHAAAAPLLTVQAIFLMAFMALGLFAAPITDADAPLAILTALSSTVAMGVQNAASRTVFASLSPTTKRFWPPVLAFAVGATCGAISYKFGGFLSILVPTVIVVALAIHTRVKAHP